MPGAQPLKNGKVKFSSYTLVAGVTPEIDLEGGTLCGVLPGEITSTTFWISVSNSDAAAGGTFVEVKDPLASGVRITYTIGSTSLGYFPISPLTTAGFRFCKLNFDQSETPTIQIAKRSVE